MLNTARQDEAFACLAVRPCGATFTQAEAAWLAAAKQQNARLVLLRSAKETDEAAAEAYAGQIVGMTFRILPDEEDQAPLQTFLAAEAIPRGRCVLLKAGRASFLQANRTLRSIASACRARLRRLLYGHQKTVEAERLSRVQPGEREALRRECAAFPQGHPRLLIVSQIAAFDKGSCAFLKRLLDEIPEWNVLHISETPRLTHKTLQEKLSTPFHRAAWAAFPNGFPAKLSGCVPADRRSGLSLAVKEASENLVQRFPSLGSEGALALSLYLEDLFTQALELFKPDRLLVWNAFTAAHTIVCALAKERGLPICYMEFGLLPGTMGLDMVGQMGASQLANESRLEMDDAACAKAEAVIAYLAERSMNRNDQQAARAGSRVFLPAAGGKKVVTVIGQNDYESGICPWNDTARREHSPWFPTSSAALKAVADACEGMEVTVVYRPHPAMTTDKLELPKGVLLAAGGDLFSLLAQSDLVVTLMSQVSYEALLHGHNVLMLGRCQLSGKGCCYELRQGEDLKESLQKALENGLTQEMRAAFRHHVARVLTTCAYDDMQPRPLRYGRETGGWRELLAPCTGDRD